MDTVKLLFCPQTPDTYPYTAYALAAHLYELNRGQAPVWCDGQVVEVDVPHGAFPAVVEGAGAARHNMRYMRPGEYPEVLPSAKARTRVEVLGVAHGVDPL